MEARPRRGRGPSSRGHHGRKLGEDDPDLVAQYLTYARHESVHSSPLHGISKNPFHAHHGWTSRSAPSHTPYRVQLSLAGGKAPGDGDSQSPTGGKGPGVFKLFIYLFNCNE